MMKKAFTILFMLSFALNAQIKIVGFVEIGYLNEKSSLNAGNSAFQYKTGNAMYSDITIDFSIKRIHFEQQIYNVFSPDNIGFSVMEIIYKSKLYYNYEPFIIGCEHMCLHPIINQHNELPFLTRRGSFNKIFIRFTFNN